MGARTIGHGHMVHIERRWKVEDESSIKLEEFNKLILRAEAGAGCRLRSSQYSVIQMSTSGRQRWEKDGEYDETTISINGFNWC